MTSVLYLTDRDENKRTLKKLPGAVLKLERKDKKSTPEGGRFDLIILDANPDTCQNLQKYIEKEYPTSLEKVVLGLNIGEDSMFSSGDENCLMLDALEGDTTSPLFKRMRKAGDRDDERINKTVVEPFMKAVIKVFETMINVTATKRDVFIKDKYSLFGDVSGVIGLSGETEGVVALTFPKKLGYHLVSKMVHCDESDLVIEDVHDGIGEIVNMVTGAAKGILAESGYKFSISVPTIITGYGHQLAHPRDEPVFVLLFEVEKQPFAVQLCISSKGNKADKKDAAKNRISDLSSAP